LDGIDALPASDETAVRFELLENPTLRRQMGEYGRRRVEENLAWKYSVPVLLDAYETLFSGQVVRRARELETADLALPELAKPDNHASGRRMNGSVVA